MGLNLPIHYIMEIYGGGCFYKCNEFYFMYKGYGFSSYY